MAGTGGTPAGLRRARAAEATAVALKAAARELFAEKGYLGTKIVDITARAGRAAGLFYNHFDSKEALLEALLADIADRTDQLVEDPGAYHDLSDPAVLRAHIGVFWTVYSAHTVEIEAVRQASLVAPEMAARFAALRRKQLRPWEDHLRDMQAAGVPLPASPALLAETLLRIVEGCCQAWLDGDRATPAAAAVDTVVAIVQGGVIPVGATPSRPVGGRDVRSTTGGAPCP